MLTFFKSKYLKIKNALQKTQKQLGFRIKSLFGKPWAEETFEEFEQILYEADLGSSCTKELLETVRQTLLKNPEATAQELIASLKQKALSILELKVETKQGGNEPLEVYLIVGVNGSGKTTSLAKLAKKLKEEGKKPLMIAADTFRAAAQEQLELFSKKLDIPLIQGRTGADPSSVVFDGLSAAQSRGHDVVLIDTAGRLQNKNDLMQELAKIRRVCQKVVPSSPHKTLLVLDSTSGQNGLDQAATFHQFTPLTALILTKLDGSAKGGVILSIYKQLKIPVCLIGLGEGIDDLIDFDAESYVDALFDT